MRTLALVVASFWLSAPAVCAQDLFPNSEYIAGKGGFESKIKGTLVVAPNAVRFMSLQGVEVFSIPTETITQVTHDVQIRDASVGSKLLWGDFAGSRKQEFVQVTTETVDAAEGVVFKVKQGTSVNVTAKIEFAMKRAKARMKPAGTQAGSSAGLFADVTTGASVRPDSTVVP